MPPSPEITIPAHQTNQLKFYKPVDAEVFIIFFLKNGKDFPTFFSLIKASLGPSCVKKEVMPSYVADQLMAEAQHRFMPKVFLAFKPSSEFSDGSSLMILRKVPQRSEEAASTVGLCGEMGVFTKLRTASKGEERARKQQVTSTVWFNTKQT